MANNPFRDDIQVLFVNHETKKLRGMTSQETSFVCTLLFVICALAFTFGSLFPAPWVKNNKSVTSPVNVRTYYATEINFDVYKNKGLNCTISSSSIDDVKIGMKKLDASVMCVGTVEDVDTKFYKCFGKN